MGKGNDACQYLSTTGAAIAVGTKGIDLYGWCRGSDLAGTIIIKDSATVLFTCSASQCVSFTTPVALSGPVTMTSSAGDHFVVFYRNRG